MPEPSPTPPLRPLAELAIFRSRPETHSLSHRQLVTPDGRALRLFLAVPRSQAPAEGYPILYMLDGNAAFDTLDIGLLAAVPGLVLAGIGYDTPQRFDVAARSRDYTPPRDEADPRPDPQRPERMIGGAALFVEALVGPLREAAEAGLPTNPARRTLWGHSLAGLCVLYTLLRKPAAFSHYASASPSIWWGDQILLDIEAATPPFAASPGALVMLGDSERRSSPDGPHWDGPAPHTLEMVERLRRRGIAVRQEIFAGLGHAATLSASLPLALDFAAAE